MNGFYRSPFFEGDTPTSAERGPFWVIELGGGRDELLYLSTALSSTSCGFTNDISRAWHFPSQETAEFVRERMGLTLARSEEHMYV